MSLSVPLEPPSKEILHISAHYLVILVKYIYSIQKKDLAEAKIYLFAILVIFDMPSTNHFFWSFCSQVGIAMVLEGFSGVFVFGLPALLYRDFVSVSDGLDLSKSG